MMRSTRLAALVAAAGGALTCSAQVFTNGDFETGNLGGWTVTPTFNGVSVVQLVSLVDIDGPGPLGTTNAGQFRVGTAASVSTFQAGIELWQNVNLTAGTGYLFAMDWAAINPGGANAEGGVFQWFVESRRLGAAQAAGSTGGTSPEKYGHLEAAFGPETSGPYRVGVRITRPFTTGTSTLNQFVDNFIITPGTTVGACCLSDGTCFSSRTTECTAAGGTYAGDGVTCAAAACPQPGACCIADAGCFIRSSAECTAMGGVYSGNGTACAGSGCPAPTAAYAPIANRTVDGGGSGSTPIVNTSAAPAGGRTYQFAIAASELAGIPAGSSLTGLTWRQDNSTTNSTPWPAADANFTQYDIQVSSNDAGPGTMLPTFADNIGGDVVTVRSGPLTILAGAFPGGAVSPAVNDWGSVIPFTTPFVYNGGPLVVTIRHSGNDQGNARLLEAVANTNAQYFTTCQALSAAGATAITGTTVVFNVVRFTLAGGGPAPCYPNCDSSTIAPILNVQDFSCFLNSFANSETYANCDNSTIPPVLNVQDFSCFLNAFANGCS